MMRLFLSFCFHLTWLTLFKITAASNDQSYKILKFGETTGDYVKFKPNMQPFSDGFSICSWIRKLRSGSDPNWLSYATSSQYNEIYLGDDGTYSYLFGSYSTNVRSQAGVTIGSWYHFCLCWDQTPRTATIYHNGTQTGTFSTAAGRRPGTDGYLVLGQDQDSYGGGFDSYQAFGGELSKLNIFSKKLTSSEVSEMYTAGRCSDIEKKHDDTRHLKWEDILQQPRTGNVRVIDTSHLCLLEQELEEVKTERDEARKKLEATKSELNNTKASEKDISQQLNRTVTDLEDKSAELDKVRAELQETTSQLTETETKLNSTEKNLEQIGTRLNETLAGCQVTEGKLEETNARLSATEETLEETKASLSAREGELQELKTNISGHNCFRMTNSSHWDILYTAKFFDQTLTEDKLQLLDQSWEKIEHFKGVSITENFIEFFKKYFPDGQERCDGSI